MTQNRTFPEIIKNPTLDEAKKIEESFTQLTDGMRAVFTPAVIKAIKNKTEALAVSADRLSAMLDQANIKKDKIFDLIESDGAIVDFLDMNICGIDLLFILSEMDERTQKKAKLLINEANKNKSKKMLDSKYEHQRRLKSEAIAFYQQHTEMSQRECIEFLCVNFPNGRKRPDPIAYPKMKGWLNGKRKKSLAAEQRNHAAE